MSKKLKIILALAAGVVILSLGSGAIVMAAGSTTTTTPATTTPATQSNALFTAVAATLGVTEQQLADAFQQATTQAENQSITQALATAVKNGTITQAESDAIQAWLAERPTSPTPDNMKAWEAEKPQITNPGALKGILGPLGRGIGWLGNVSTDNTALLTQVVTLLNQATGKSITVAQLQAAMTKAEAQMKSDALTQALSNAVANGTITQDEANQIQSWWNQRPSAVDKLPGFGFFGKGAGSPGMGFGGMMRSKDFRGVPQGTAPTTTTTQPNTY
ncbi:MAG: hypothetical protein ACLPVI_05310 [Dehalococcoidales bacterium]